MRNRQLWSLLLASGISQIGDQMALIALPWFVLETTGSPLLTGVAGAVTLLPSFIGGLFGGILVDRCGYQRISIVADFVSAVGVGLIPLLYSTIGLAFWQLLVLMVLRMLLVVPGLTARRALLPSIAQATGIALGRVTAVYESLQNGALLAGPPLAGLLIALFGAISVLWLDAISFVISALLIAWGIPNLRTGTPLLKPLRHELLAGFLVVWRDRVLLLLALNLAAANILSNALFGVVLPVFATIISGRPTDLGLLMAAYGFGTLVGIALFVTYGQHWPRRRTWLTGWFGLATATWLLAPVPTLPIAIGALFVGGIANGPLNPLLVTIRLERIPSTLRGRGFSAFSAFAMASAPLGPFLGGLLITQFGLATTLTTLACGYTAIVLGLWLMPVLHQINVSQEQPITLES